MNTLKANTNKPWLDSVYDLPVLENEEEWTQRVIDEASRDLILDIEKEENVRKTQHNKNNA